MNVIPLRDHRVRQVPEKILRRRLSPTGKPLDAGDRQPRKGSGLVPRPLEGGGLTFAFALAFILIKREFSVGS